MALGVMVSGNQTGDVDACRKLASELGHEVVDTGYKEEEYLGVPAVADDEAPAPGFEQTLLTTGNYRIGELEVSIESLAERGEREPGL